MKTDFFYFKNSNNFKILAFLLQNFDEFGVTPYDQK